VRISDVTGRIGRFARLPRSVSAVWDQTHQLRQSVQASTMLAADAAVARVKGLGPRRPLRDAEFQVFSQWGDDGIIQYLLHQVPSLPEVFVEFGVQDYRESNTRFLLMHDNWSGLVMDGSEQFVSFIQSEDIYWRYDLTAVASFLTRENINDVIRGAGFSGPIGILSVDIDGNDYWVWEAIDVVDPTIVIVEYNSVFGPDRAVSVPYDPGFVRTKAHSSNLFWGCSVAALCHLAERKGYAFVGCNLNGNNAYFVKKSAAANLKQLTCKEGYVLSRFRESRDEQGNLTFLRGEDRFNAIADMRVVDVKTGQQVRLGDS
jgi:hypothetical protein